MILQNRGRRGGFQFKGLPNSGRGALGPAGALIFLGITGYALSTALFNGELILFDASMWVLMINGYRVAVDGGHRAIKYSRLSGVKKEIYNEGIGCYSFAFQTMHALIFPFYSFQGTHLKIPWIETPVIYDVRAKPRNVASLTGTKDLQMVNITCRVLSRPKVDALPQIYRTLGQDFDERVLPSIVNEVLKSVVAQFNASQLITQRENVARLVRENLSKRAARFNITLDDVSLTVSVPPCGICQLVLCC
jgi:prohibitin 2